MLMFGTERSGVEHILMRDAGDLLAAIGNSEAKAVLFGAMALHADGYPFSTKAIHDLFLDVQGEQNKAWPDIARPVTQEYVLQSFEPIGAVMHSEVSIDGGLYTRYFVNGYGQERGLGAAGLMLDYSLTHENVALYSLVGGAVSKSETGRRAPATRIKILSQLQALRGKSITIKELVDHTQSKLGAIEAQLAGLEAIGAVSVARRKRNEDERKLVITNARDFMALKLHDRKGAITSDIHSFVTAKLAAGQDVINMDELTTYLQTKHSDLSREQIRKRTITAVWAWKEKELLRLQSGFAQAVRSGVALHPDGRRIVEDYLLIVNALMEGDQDFLEWGKERALEIITDPETVNLLLAKARRASPFKNSEPQQVYAERVMSLIEPGESVTIEEVASRVQRQGKSSSNASAGKILAMLVAAGRLERIDYNHKAYFSVIDAD